MNENEPIKPFGKSICDWSKTMLTGSTLAAILAVASILGAFGLPATVQMPFWVGILAAALILMATIAVAIYLAGRNEHRERLKLAERLKPKLEFAGVRLPGSGEDHYRVMIRNVIGRTVRFKTRLRKAQPELEGGFPLPVSLEPTHRPLPDNVGEVGPYDECPVDVFVNRQHGKVWRERVIGTSVATFTEMQEDVLGLKLMGDPPRLHPISRTRKQELLIVVYPISEEGGLDELWFCIDPQPDGSVGFSAADRPARPKSG